jgi:hypothetical protein
MKINKKDLEPSIIEKVEQFDRIKEGFTSEDKSGFVAFNGNEFYIRRVNDLLIRGIFSEKDIESYKNHLYKESNLEKNSFNSYINEGNVAVSTFKSLSVKPVEQVLYRFTSNIVLHARLNEELFVLTEKGALVRYNLKKRKHEDSFDLLTYIKNNFAIQDVSIYDFLAAEVIPGGVLLSTKNNGVFLYSSQEKTLEIKFVESSVSVMKYLGNNTVVFGVDRVDNNVLFFNLEGQKIESSNVLKRKIYQMPFLIDSSEENLIVVGRPYGIETTKDIVHYWKKDKANVSFNNLDGKIFPGYQNKRYSVRHLTVTKSSVYISGIKEDGKLFIWQYDLEELEKPFNELSFEKFSFKDLSFVDMNESYFVIGESDNLYFLNANGDVEKNLKLNEKIKTVILSEFSDEFFYVSNDKIIFTKIPEYSEKEVILNLYASETLCNNIDVYLKSSTGKEKVVFFDRDTLNEVTPYYHAVHGGDIIVKLLETNSKNISMKIVSPKDSIVEGVVVSKNKLFMK